MLAGLVAGLGFLLALVALGSVRRLTRKLDALNQSYWELRYDYTRLRSQVGRLDPDRPAGQDGPPEPADTPVQGATVSFVPLSTIRKKDRSG